MKTKYTNSKIRLQNIYEANKKLNLVLIPGGPGMGSEYFQSLVGGIQSFFSIWLVDLPGNGDNQYACAIDYDLWPQLICEISSQLDGEIIYLGHSFGGMLLLSTPEIQNNAKAFILMSTLPKTIFFEGGGSYFDNKFFKQHIENYKKSPSDNAFKNLVVALSFFYFQGNDLIKGKAMLKQTKYAHRAYDYLLNNFLPNYKAKYIPSIPTLIVSGEKDIVTPIKYFKIDKKFKKKNIVIKEISNGNHFPWVSNPKETMNAVTHFIEKIAKL